MSTFNSTTEDTAGDKASIGKAMDEVNKDICVKVIESKKTPIVDAKDTVPSVEHTSTNKSETLTAEKPMVMKFRKGNMFINCAEANATSYDK